MVFDTTVTNSSGTAITRFASASFLLDSAVEDEEATELAEERATEEVVPHFSFHAIAGVSLNKTMQIHL